MSTTTPSFINGPTSPSLLSETIGECFDRIVKRYADRDALVVCHQDIRWTYGELAVRVDSLAAGLAHLGIKPGERIGIWAPNCAEWLLTQLASAKLGLILVNINPAYRSMELEYALNAVGCRALVMSKSVKSNNFVETLVGLAPELGHCPPGALTAARLPSLKHVLCLAEESVPGMLRFADVASSDGSPRVFSQFGEALCADDPINIQFTSGTTGQPKGATLTHRNILNNGFLVGEGLGLTAADRLCVPVPLYHCFGMVMGNLGCITHGSTIVYPSEVFDPWAVLQAIEHEACSALYGVPTMYIAELEHPRFSECALSSLRTGIMSGAPCPMPIMKRVASEMHLREITIAYGMTETSPVSTLTKRDDALEIRTSTVGTALPHVELKLVDSAGQIVPRGVPGEVRTRGYLVMHGYWGDAARTREAIDADGWMHSGDLAVMDDHGYLRIVGRLKDMVIRGGENIYPREIEDFLYKHPKVAEVSVVGVPDAKYGEELCAWVRLQAGAVANEEEIRDFCRNRIAHFKVPRYVRFVDRFPMTVTGKIQKFRIREQMISDLGLS